MHYRHWSPEWTPRGRILLLHGFGSSTFSFRYLVPELLAAGWDVAAADIPPFGYSDKTDALARLGFDRGTLLWAVPDDLRWDGPVVLLGHSMGALYAQAMAEARPAQTRALVFLAGAVPADGKPQNGSPFFAGLLAGPLDSWVHSWTWVRDTLRSFAGEDVPDALVDGYAGPFQMARAVPAFLEWSSSPGQRAVVHPGAIRVPSLLLWGDKDTIVPPETGRKLAAVLPDSELVLLPGLGHLAHERQPELVNPVVAAFLDKLP